MLWRIAPIVAACAMLAAFEASPAAAQTQSGAAPAQNSSSSTLPLFVGASTLAPGWTLSASPYLWTPTVTGKVNTPALGGSVATTSINVPFSDYVRDIRFGLIFAGQARYDRFSVMTDFLYLNLGMSVGAAHLTSVSGPTGRIDIPVSLQASDSVGTGTTIWTTAAGYTLAAGPWGNIDAIGGVRLLDVDILNNYTLNAAVTAPNGTVALTRTGSLTMNSANWEAVGGMMGRLNVPNSNFFVPFYFDVGTGNLPLTWQAFSGVGYHASWADLSLGYRYIAFENKSGAAVNNLELGGLIATAVFHF